MSLIAISIFVNEAGEIPDALQRAAAAIAEGARLIEWRIDGLAAESHPVDAMMRLVRDSPGPCIVTCRPTYEGGEFTGDDDTRLMLLEHLARADDPPRFLDVEFAAVTRSRQWRYTLSQAIAGHGHGSTTSLMYSSHDFDRRPADLLQRIETMTNEPSCSIIKIAWRARSLRDNLEAFDLLLSRQKPMIALCMGPFGLMSRALAPKFGGFLTFATDASDAPTAPGQPTVRELRQRLRFDAIGPGTRVYGVIGWPVEQSRSPDVHNAGFEAVDHDGVLLPMPIPPEYEHFKATVGALIDHPKLDFRGAAVTLPHKEHLVRFVRERGGRLDELADRIGAANTLQVGSAGGLSCMNTDSPAAVEALAHGMSIDETQLHEKHVLVLGAGGVARAVVAGLTRAGANVRVVNRDQAKATRLMDDLHVQQPTGDQHVDVVINCTPIGMAGGPDPNGLPLTVDGEDITLDHSMTVFDTVYNPQRTPLIAEAESRGAQVVTGIDMFIRQAAMQFHAWTGHDAPLDVFERALEPEQ